MGLKFVIPNMEKTFGNLEFVGEDKTGQRRADGHMAVPSRGFSPYSDVRRAGDIAAILPTEAGEKHSDFEGCVELANPRTTTEDYKTNTRGFTNYILHADDMVKVWGKGGHQTMRSANRIVIDKKAAFGTLKLSAPRQEVHIQNKDGTVSKEIKEHTCDLKSRGQGRMVQVSIPASMPLKEFDYNTEVETAHLVADTVTTTTSRGADMDWYIKAEDIISKKGVAVNLQPPEKDHPAEK